MTEDDVEAAQQGDLTNKEKRIARVKSAFVNLANEIRYFTGCSISRLEFRVEENLPVLSWRKATFSRTVRRINLVF